MPELRFQVEGVEPERFAPEPQLRFRLAVSEARADDAEPTPIHSVLLRCQVRIEPGRRRYAAEEQARLLDLFGTPERWGQTLRPMPWAQVVTLVPAFRGEGTADLLVPCSFDFNLAATRYFAALEDGEIPLGFLFSGTIFYEGPEGTLQVAQIPWESESRFRLPEATWRAMMDLHHPNTAWVGLRRDVFDRLDRYRRLGGHPTWERALERLLASAEEPVTP
jgi:hypothetical protein